MNVAQAELNEIYENEATIRGGRGEGRVDAFGRSGESGGNRRDQEHTHDQDTHHPPPPPPPHRTSYNLQGGTRIRTSYAVRQTRT